VKSYLLSAWRFIRTLSNDDAYERYLERHARTHPELPPLSPRAFYDQQQQEKWGGVNRCC